MERIFGKFEPQIYAILRIIAGFLFFQHGTQKLLGFPAFVNPCPCAPPPAMPDFMQTVLLVGGIIELLAGVLIMLGFLTGLAAFLASGMMAVAYFMAHQANGALPILNQGEPAVLYCFIFLYIAARGAGVWSIDALRRGDGEARI